MASPDRHSPDPDQAEGSAPTRSEKERIVLPMFEGEADPAFSARA